MTTTPQPQSAAAPRLAAFRTASGRVLEGLLVAWPGVAAVAFAFGLMQRSLIRWLAPFANLYIPVRVVNDIWNGTARWEREHRAAVPGEPRGSGRVLPVVGLWWAAYLVGGFLALRANAAEQEIRSVADALEVNAIYLGRDVLLFAAAGLALVIVHSVNRARPADRTAAHAHLEDTDLDTHDRFWR